MHILKEDDNGILYKSNIKKAGEPTNDADVLEGIINAIQDTKGKEIVKMDLTGLDDAPTDYFIICEGESNSQVKGIAEKVKINLKRDFKIMPSHVEGEREARWILLDYFNIVVHIFYHETRDFYELEDLWNDAKIKEISED